jgi:hypothetical protein
MSVQTRCSEFVIWNSVPLNFTAAFMLSTLAADRPRGGLSSEAHRAMNSSSKTTAASVVPALVGGEAGIRTLKWRVSKWLMARDFWP